MEIENRRTTNAIILRQIEIIPNVLDDLDFIQHMAVMFLILATGKSFQMAFIRAATLMWFEPDQPCTFPAGILVSYLPSETDGQFHLLQSPHIVRHGLGEFSNSGEWDALYNLAGQRSDRRYM